MRILLNNFFILAQILSMKYGLFFLLFYSFVSAQDKYPKDYFGSPLNIELSIAGSFGELRPNHFHSGIDFRTQKKEGFPVFATADGFISRINVSNFGYGKCLYIDHPNGFTTVYAHLQMFSPDIDKYTRANQYELKSYTLELRPDAGLLPVKKGDLIGYSGNTGGSSGPHLHFEIRDTKSEFIINPFLFGYDALVKDSKAPIVNGIIAYSLGDDGNVNGSSKPITIPLTLEKDGSYLASRVTASGKIGFAINAHDISDFNYGKNGIFKLDAYLNGLPYYSYEFDSFSFDETKHINCFIDYPRYKQTHQRFQKLFVCYLYPENIIKAMKNSGKIDISSNVTMNYKVVIQDFHGNKSVINIPISYGLLPLKYPKEDYKTAYFLKSQNEHSYVKDGVSVFVPENTFYDDFYVKFDVKNNELYFHDESVAMNNPVTITFDVSKIAQQDRAKMFIGNMDRGNLEYNNTFKKEDSFSIKVKKLGKFLLAKDTIAPKIYSPNFKEAEQIDSLKTLKISISDDLSGISEYEAYLNGKWILMEYESKLNRLTHYFSDDMYQDGRNEFKLIVRDNLGNSSIFESYFLKTKS